MRNLPAIFCLGALCTTIACGRQPGADDSGSDADTDSDTDTDTDSDTDTDTDTDTDMDTDADTDTDSDADADCTARDLRLWAEARDSGGPCTTCASGDDLVMTGVILNPCEDPVAYVSLSDCLVTSYSVEEIKGGASDTIASECEGGETETPVLPDQAVSESVTWGSLDPGDYRISVTFNDPTAHVSSAVFTVE